MSNGSRKNSTNEVIGSGRTRRHWGFYAFDFAFPLGLTLISIEIARWVGWIDKNQMDLGVVSFLSRFFNF